MNNNTLWQSPLLSRRKFLQMTAISSATMLLASCGRPQENRTAASARTDGDATNSVDIEVALTAAPATAAILPGAETNIWHYTGELLQGDESALTMLDNAYLGPILRVYKGQRVRIHFRNELPEASIIHWHGLIVPEAMDGHPRYTVESGESYVYEFTVNNQAGTYWFHPHPHGRTGIQAYMGLAGLFIVTDDEEAALDLPTGDYDIPLVLQDRLFDAENQLVYTADADASGGMMRGMNHGNMGNNMDNMMAQMMGQLGDQMLVNGQPNAALEVATRVYRLRLVNGSNARIYKLAWDDDTPLTVIGTDAGLLARPVTKEYVTLGPGARVDLWADFSTDEVGTARTLRSLAFTGVEMGNMTEMMNANGLAQGTEFSLLTVNVTRAEAETRTLPEQLVSLTRLDPATAANGDEPRRIELAMDEMQWTLNGRTFEMDGVAADEQVQLGTHEVWEFVNLPGRGMMADFMAHPMHIHGVHFQVLNRDVDPAYRAGRESVSAGYVDEGWRDTVLVMPGENVQVLAQFTEPGTFLYHCHNLEHEDMGMMRNFTVT